MVWGFDQESMSPPRTIMISCSPAKAAFRSVRETPSTFPDTVAHRHSKERGQDPVWVLDIDTLDPELSFRPDPTNSAHHGFLEPAHLVTLVQYQQAIARTRTSWTKVI